MKIKGLLLFVLFLLKTTLMAQEIVFDATVDHSDATDTGPQSVEKKYLDNTIKIGISNEIDATQSGVLNHTTHYAVYTNSILTISVDGDLKIVKLELVRSNENTNKLTSLEFTTKGGKILKNDVDRKIWIGLDASANSVSLKASSRVYLSKIIVTLNTFKISEAGFATMWLDNGYIMPEGVIGHSINIENGKLVYLKNYMKGDNIPEKFPLLIEGKANIYKYEPSKYEYNGNSNNKLIASTGSRIPTTGNHSDGFLYKFSYDSNGKNLGFYWDSDNGKSVTVPYGKCCLMISEKDLASSGTANAKGFSLSDIVNGIGNITDTTSETDKKVYDLRGVFLGYDLDGLPKGIYIQNGKKVVIK